MERIARAVLLMRCRAATPATAPAAGVLPFLESTALADFAVSGLRFRSLPSKITATNAEREFAALLSTPADQLPLMVEYGAKSSCPNLLLLLADEHVLGMQLKNYGAGSVTTMRDVTEEAAKSVALIRAQAARPRGGRHVLVIASTHVHEDVLTGTPLRVTVGGAKIKGRGAAAAENVHGPEADVDVEVVVLSKAQLDALFGRSQLAVLERVRQ